MQLKKLFLENQTLAKAAILVVVVLVVLLIKDRPSSAKEFFNTEKAGIVRTFKVSLYRLKADISPIDRDKDLYVYLDGIPFHRQEHSLSCEMASLKMALGYYGVDVSEADLISELKFDTTGPRQKNNIWGDPENGFVGNIDGKMPNSGYGVYEGPVADVAVKYRPAKPIKGAILEDILNAVAEKHPVIIWVTLPGNYDISWKTAGGKDIVAQYGEHARLLVGFSGTINDPKDLFFIDPVYGRMRISKKDFVKAWNLLDNRALIVE
ncbi:MAG: C39 family peptidase [Patescibacteria group bacterium]